MTTPTTTSLKGPRKVSAVIGWFPTTPATEREIIDMANSRQVALRTRLRHLYWLTECKAIGQTTVDLARRKMALIDPQDTLTDAQVAELLTTHYGFEPSADGWVIPDLDEAREDVVGSVREARGRAQAAGRASAAKRTAAKGVSSQSEQTEPVPTAPASSVDDDF